MKLAFFSDIHANLEALETVVKEIEVSGADEIVCLGDIVGYGANPSECLAIVRERCSAIVLGNHDEATFLPDQAFQFNLHAGIATQWTYHTLSEAEKKFLSSLPLSVIRDGVLCVHSSPGELRLWEYITDEVDALVAFSEFTQKICCVGHSHVAGIYPENPRLKPSDPGYRAVVNVGSVGQPRDGNPRASWCMIDTSTMEIRINRVGYDIETAARKIREVGLPPSLADRLYKGV